MAPSTARYHRVLSESISRKKPSIIMKIHPTAMTTDRDLEDFVSLVRGFFDQKGMHMQFNVVSRETLLDAQKNPEKYHAGYVNFKLKKNNTNYVMNNEKVTLKVTDGDNNVITEQTVTTANYMGDGYYVAWLNILEAKKLKNISVTNIDIKIKNGATDITSTFDISCIEIQEWVNEIK